MVHRSKMSDENRAAQFAPFAALEGFTGYVQAVVDQQLWTEKHSISEEQIEENSRVLMKLKKGMLVEIDYHDGFMDVTKTGAVTDIELAFHWLKLDGEKIFFEDIYKIQKIYI